MPNNFNFAQVDVFTDDPLKGNPVAVVTVNDNNLSNERMQNFANWTNLSETTFILPSNNADYKLKIFTPKSELPFAGHPTLGSASVYLDSLTQQQRSKIIDNGGKLVQDCGIGLVELKWDYQSNVISFVAPPLIKFEKLESDIIVDVCESMNIDSQDVVDGYWVVNGPQWFALKLKDASKVLNANILNKDKILNYNFGLFGEYSSHHEGVKFEVRCFAPLLGVDEDPVTGSLK